MNAGEFLLAAIVSGIFVIVLTVMCMVAVSVRREDRGQLRHMGDRHVRRLTGLTVRNVDDDGHLRPYDMPDADINGEREHLPRSAA